MKPYQPSLVVPAGGMALLIVTAILGGAAIGALVSILSTSLIYLIIFFPIAMGLVAGLLIAVAVRAGKVRHPGVAMGAAILMGLVIYTTMWTVDYFQYRNVQMAAIQSSTDTEKEAVFNQQLEKQTGQSGFLGFVLLRNQNGEVFGRQADGNYLINLGPTFSWIYWILEVALILWMSVTFGRRPAYDPFCEECNRWFGKPELIGTLGASRKKEFLDLISNGQFLKLGEELQSNPALPNIGLFMADSGSDCADGGAFLAVRLQTRNSSGSVAAKDIETGLITSPQMQDLRRGIENRKALYGG